VDLRGAVALPDGLVELHPEPPPVAGELARAVGRLAAFEQHHAAPASRRHLAPHAHLLPHVFGDGQNGVCERERGGEGSGREREIRSVGIRRRILEQLRWPKAEAKRMEKVTG
jgi:hypothetical protein